MEDNQQVRKIGIELASDGNTLCILAGEMDSENLWEERNETEFISNVLRGLTVEIGRGEYIYRIENNDGIDVSFVNLETGERLCDYITLEKLMCVEESTEDIKVIHSSGDYVSFEVLGEHIMFREIKLLSFKKRKSIIQIVL